MTFRIATRLAIALAAMIATGIDSLEAAEMMLHGGSFVGASGHDTHGGVAIVKDGDVTKLVLKGDFATQAAPDAKLAFGKNGYVKGTIFSKLEKNEGMQEYVIPAGVDVATYNEVWLWCEKFNVPLGMAKLN